MSPSVQQEETTTKGCSLASKKEIMGIEKKSAQAIAHPNKLTLFEDNKIYRQ